MKPVHIEATRQAQLRADGLAQALRAEQEAATDPADRAALGFASHFAFKAAAALNRALSRLEGRASAVRKADL